MTMGIYLLGFTGTARWSANVGLDLFASFWVEYHIAWCHGTEDKPQKNIYFDPSSYGINWLSLEGPVHIEG